MSDTIAYRYWAFISYSNQDKSWARWLHRAIETYGIPARLVSHPTPTGEPAPKRLRPLFHDRAELPASSDLGAQIEDALRASRFLIVICSPHAARSKWVNKEIETFLSMGRPGRVLAIIVDGEPNAGDERECFPPALRQAEPIAADARPEGDGKGDAKLKLLAGMLGIGFDGLKRRDTHRRMRRLQFAIGSALTLAVGFAGLALYAERQREKAVKARQQAEGILEYLLFDLRDKLEPVGRLDVLRDLQERVNVYYEELGVDNRDVGTLLNQSAAFLNKGDLLLAQGDLEGALREYQASLRVIGPLASSFYVIADWQRSVSVRHVRIGRVLQAQGDLVGALREYQRSLQVFERLASSDLTNAVWQRDVSVSHARIGDVLQAQGDLTGALHEYQVSLQVIERLASSDPSNTVWQRDVSVSHARIGDVLQAQGNLTGALREYQVRLQVIERLASSDPSNTVWQRDVSISHIKLGDVLQAQGDLAGALREYQASLQAFERLASSDPSNPDWQRGVFVGYSTLALFAEQTGQGDAMAWWRKAYEQLSDMKQRGMLQSTDETALAQLKRMVEG